MVLIVLRPLLHADSVQFPDYLTRPSIENHDPGPDAEEVYRQIMRDLIEKQTEDLLRDQAEMLGVSVRFRVEIEKDEASGQLIPWAVYTIGMLTPEQHDALSRYMKNVLNIPAERQRWAIS